MNCSTNAFVFFVEREFENFSPIKKEREREFGNFLALNANANELDFVISANVPDRRPSVASGKCETNLSLGVQRRYEKQHAFTTVRRAPVIGNFSFTRTRISGAGVVFFFLKRRVVEKKFPIRSQTPARPPTASVLARKRQKKLPNIYF